MTPRVSAVYAIRNVKNGHCYIGSTADFSNRRNGHLGHLRRGTHHSAILQAAFRKHGEAAFAFEIVELVADLSQLVSIEQRYLTPRPFYNVSAVAGPKTRLGMKSTEQHRRNMSAALKGRPGTMNGRRFTEQHRRRLSESQKGRKGISRGPRSEEVKRKMRINHNPISDRNLIPGGNRRHAA